MKFSGVITNDQSKVHAKGQGQRSKVKVTEVTTQLNRFRTVTPVWIHQWVRNAAQSLKYHRRGALLFLAATKQLYKWYFPSVRLSVCLSVTPFWLCSHHPIIMKFSGVITNDQSKVHAKGQGQRSKVKVTEVTTQLNRFRTVTPVWIHIWWWNDSYSLVLLKEVPYCFSRSSVKFQGHTALKIVECDLDWAFPDCNSSLNSPMATKWCTKLEVA